MPMPALSVIDDALIKQIAPLTAPPPGRVPMPNWAAFGGFRSACRGVQGQLLVAANDGRRR
jgi:hypothetical protein